MKTLIVAIAIGWLLIIALIIHNALRSPLNINDRIMDDEEQMAFLAKWNAEHPKGGKR